MNNIMSLLEKKPFLSKLLWGFALCLTITLFIGINSVYTVKTLSNKSDKLYHQQLSAIAHLKEANINLVTIGKSLRSMILATNAKERDQAMANINASIVTLELELDEARKIMTHEQQQKLLHAFNIRFEGYQRDVQQVITLMDNEPYVTSKVARYLATDKFTTLSNNAEELLTKLYDLKEAETEQEAESLWTISYDRQLVAMMVFAMALSAVIGGLIVWSIIRPTRSLQAAIEGLAAGNLDVDIGYLDYPNEIGALARALKIWQQTCLAMENQGWLKEQVTAISREFAQVNDFTELPQKFMSRVCPLLKVGYGVFYSYKDNKLHLSGSYGHCEQLHQEFMLGESLVGQCALEKKPITLINPPDNYLQINSGLGQAPAKAILALPVLHNNCIMGVVEFASFQVFTEIETALLDALLPLLAMNMELNR